MKKSWKLMICGLMVLLIANLTVRPTLAWLSAGTDPVVNYFSGGGIGLRLDEAPVDEHGKRCDGDRVTENHYKYIAGAVLDKDPTVTVLANSERCYVYVCVMNELPEAYFKIDLQEDHWTLVLTDRSMSIYRYEDIVESSEEDQSLTPVFTQISVSKDLDYEIISALGSRQLSVTAYAVQADSMEQDTADTLAEDYFRENVEITDVEPAEPVQPSKPDKPHKSTSTLEGDTQGAAVVSENDDSTETDYTVNDSEETGTDSSGEEAEASAESGTDSSNEEAGTTGETGADSAEEETETTGETGVASADAEAKATGETSTDATEEEAGATEKTTAADAAETVEE